MSKSPKWFSINVNDSTSDYYESFEEAVQNDSIYIVKREFAGTSQSGSTFYYRYSFYTSENKRIFPNLNGCKFLEVGDEGWSPASSYYEFVNLNEIGRKRIRWIFPFALSNSAGTGCAVTVRDSKGKIETIGLKNFREDFWPFFKELSRTGCWDEFILSNFLNVIKTKAESTKRNVTKYGYSKIEFAFENCKSFGYDVTYYKKSFDRDIKLMSIVRPLCEDIFSTEVLMKQVSSFSKIESIIEFTTNTLEGKKPWRR
ncbi:hypothetical protein ACFSRY_10075 [Pontibacter locisalis]|uniref:Uncharacterized protein n=1 Tax=Pontibacter locisalis TaxID=1719035 RepID=A0ABW5IKM3_9BACT